MIYVREVEAIQWTGKNAEELVAWCEKYGIRCEIDGNSAGIDGGETEVFMDINQWITLDDADRAIIVNPREFSEAYKPAVATP